MDFDFFFPSFFGDLYVKSGWTCHSTLAFNLLLINVECAINLGMQVKKNSGFRLPDCTIGRGSGVFWLQQTRDELCLSRIVQYLFDSVEKSISDVSFKVNVICVHNCEALLSCYYKNQFHFCKITHSILCTHSSPIECEG